MSNTFVLQQALQAFNFSDKEAVIYLATLELGKGTASQIGRKAQINRSTTYVILDILINKGLVNMLGKEPKQEYVAEPPTKLVQLMRTVVEQDQDNLKQVQ